MDKEVGGIVGREGNVLDESMVWICERMTMWNFVCN